MENDSVDRELLAYRVQRVEERLDGLDAHGSRQLVGVIGEQARQAARIHELEGDVREIPLLRLDVQRYADSFKAMRNALYAVAGTIIAAAVAILLFGGGGA